MATSIPCSHCGAQLRLADELVSRLAGRTGRLACKVCGARLRLDGRQGMLTASVEQSPVSAAALLSRPPEPRAPELRAPSLGPRKPGSSDRPVAPQSARFEAQDLESVRPAAPSSPEVIPPPLPSDVRNGIPSVHDLARQSQGAIPPRRGSSRLTRGGPAFLREDVDEPLASSPETARELEVRAFYLNEALPPAAAHVPAAETVTSRAPRPPRRSSLPTPLEGVPIPEAETGLLGTAPGSVPPREAGTSHAPVSLSVAPPPPNGRRGAGLWTVLAAAVLGGAIAAPETREFIGHYLSSRSAVTAAPMAKPAVDSKDLVPHMGVKTPAPTPAAVAEEEPTSAAPAAITPVRTPGKPAVKAKAPELKAAPEEKPAESAAVVEEPAPTGPPFDETRASLAMKAATQEASTCRKEGDPTGQAHVVVTFSPTGRVTSATISGPPFAGTPVGSCIASQFRSIRVEPFVGERVTITRDVVIY